MISDNFFEQFWQALGVREEHIIALQGLKAHITK